jgi:hypothetical protein
MSRLTIDDLSHTTCLVISAWDRDGLTHRQPRDMSERDAVCDVGCSGMRMSSNYWPRNRPVDYRVLAMSCGQRTAIAPQNTHLPVTIAGLQRAR